MDRSDIEFLRHWLETVPEFSEEVRVNPPEALQGGRWRSIVGIKTMRNRLLLRLAGRRTVRLPLQPNRRNSKGPADFWKPILRSHFPRARVRKLLAETDRIRHQSGAFLRMVVREGRHEKALIWVPPEEGEELRERLLSSLLLWWAELVGSRQPSRAACFIPAGWSCRIASGFSHLRLPVRCYQYGLETGAADGLLRIYPAPPQESAVSLPYVIFPHAESAPADLRELAGEFPQLRLSRRAAGWELDYKGLPVAWTPRGARGARFDIRRPRKLADGGDFHRHLKRVERFRRFPPPARGHPYFSWKPERWLEHEVIQDHRAIDPAFGREIHSQVPTCVDGERKILDLLTCTRGGRLAVIELKASQDLNLIFQALEYWSRVGVHLERGDFQQMGYFASRRLQPRTPLLYLVCPLFEYHRVLPVFRRYLNPEVKFRCIGVNSDWRKGLRVIRRFEF